MKRFFVLSCLLIMPLALSACGVGSMFEGEKEAPPLEGERISILELQNQLEPDDGAEKAKAVALPEIWKNDFWPQAGGYPNHSMQNLAFTPNKPERAWRSDIGTGTQGALPLTSQPVVADGRVYTLDTESRLSAFDVKSGDTLWRTNVRKKSEDDEVIGGGVSFSGGVLYVTSGYDELLAVNPADGQIYWRAPLNAPSRAAPTILDGRVFVSTLNNSIMAFSATDGTLLWDYTGISGNTTLLGAAAPAAMPELVIPAFSSGEVVALRAGNGSVAWSDSLANVLRLGGLSDLSDITGLPVIDKGVVIAVSFGGKMSALDALTGRRIWTKEIGSLNTPWVAGSHIFIITTNNEIVALTRDKGTILWVSRLARKDGNKPISWAGPVMAGGRLMAFSDDGRAAEVNPADGSLLREWSTGESIRLAPAISGGTLYLLSEDGSLSAYR